MLRTCDLEYDLPDSQIATRAVEPRDAARLLVVGRTSADVRHLHVRDLPDLLDPGDLLVFNTTTVLPARFAGRRVGTGGRVGGLFLHEPAEGEWVCLLRGRHLRPGVEIELQRPDGSPAAVMTLVEKYADEPGAWRLRIAGSVRAARPLLAMLGQTPLPPYILGARAARGDVVDDREDRARYQTIYAGESPQVPGQGSVAAPTAGLHFTPELLGRLASKGVRRADVVLHVGTGTFRPVETEFVEEHPMHAEWCSMSAEAIEAVLRVQDEGRRVIPIGTTSARTIESYATAMRTGTPMGPIATRMLITPGYQWQWCSGLMTNFHLPRSTLLAMVSSLFPDSIQRVHRLYAEAIASGYRFYSFGDAMLVLG